MSSSMRKRGSLGGWSAGIVAAALLGGCSEYKYFDIHVAFDPASYDKSTAQQATICRVTVSGKASSTFTLPPGLCPNRTETGDPLDAGTFEFASFADSGSLTFKVEAFTGLGLMPQCVSGDGTTTVPVTSPSMIKGEVVIKKGTNPACTNVTQPMDASIDL